MIDYVKILINDVDLNRLTNLPSLEFKTEVSERTGELSNKKTAKYLFCKITIYDSGIVLFTGSIHKFWNALHDVKAPNYNSQKEYKGFNGNDFTINNILEVKYHLEGLFNCDADNFIYQNIEFGVNVHTSYDPKLIIRGLLIHKGKEFEFRHNGNYAQSVHNRFIFKIYNKGHQYRMIENVLRVELKIIKMQEVKSLGIISMAEIDEEILNKVKSLLLKRWKEILFYDITIRKNELSGTSKEFYTKYSNPRFWLHELKSNHRDRHKKRLKEIVLNNSSNSQKKILDLIEEKCVIINQHSKGVECVTNNSSNIELSNTHLVLDIYKRYCQLTGRDITMQKESSFLLSHAGLKYIHKNDRDLFEKVKKHYLTRKWIDCDIQTKIREIAHIIRDKWRRQKTTYGTKNQLTIFGMEEIKCNPNINHFLNYNSNLSKVEENRWKQH